MRLGQIEAAAEAARGDQIEIGVECRMQKRSGSTAEASWRDARGKIWSCVFLGSSTGGTRARSLSPHGVTVSSGAREGVMRLDPSR